MGFSVNATVGVPFHPKDQPPKAPCPLCFRNNQDYTAKILYAIRGTAKGEYDINIPPEYFQVPPQQLGNSGNEALRVCQPARWLVACLEAHQMLVPVRIARTLRFRALRNAWCYSKGAIHMEGSRKLHRGLSCCHRATQPVCAHDLTNHNEPHFILKRLAISTRPAIPNGRRRL